MQIKVNKEIMLWYWNRYNNYKIKSSKMILWNISN